MRTGARPLPAPVLRGLHEITPRLRGAVVTAGTFDGVHAGHRVLLAGAREHADRLGAPLVAITWDRHPFATVRPPAVPPLLCSRTRRDELLLAAGADAVLELRFDRAFAALPPERFATEVLGDVLGAAGLHLGGDWRFGRGARGDAALLRRLGFAVETVGRATFGGEPGSSSAARDAVLAGDLERATRLLGRPVELEGRAGSNGDLTLDGALARPPAGGYEGTWDATPCHVVVRADGHASCLPAPPRGPVRVALTRRVG